MSTMSTTLRAGLWVTALALALPAPAHAAPQRRAAPKQKQQRPTPATRAPMDEKAMMELWQKVATPGPAHRVLEPVIGTWDAKVTTWTAPNAPPHESSGTSVNEWVLGGRWVQQRFDGSYMGSPVLGLGYTGYDNLKKRYVGTWMDTMSTSLMMTSGPASAGTNLTMTGTIDDLMTGKPSKVRSTLRFIDTDHHVYEMWGTDPEGREYKAMEIHYHRKK